MAQHKKMVSLLFLCGGQGKRFQEVVPQIKPCQLIYSRPMYKWVLETVLEGRYEKGIKSLVIATHNDTYGNTIYTNILREYSNKFPCIQSIIPYPTRGPAETCYLCLNHIVADKPFWVLDNDILYDNSIDWGNTIQPDKVYVVVQQLTKEEQKIYKKGGYSPYSHVVLDNKGYIIDIVEKVYNSEYVVLGAYGFGSRRMYESMFLHSLNTTKFTEQKEWFMSCIIKQCIASGIVVKALVSNNSISIGTPEQVEQAILRGHFQPKPLRWVFDLDNTIVTSPLVPYDYSTVIPIKKVINFIKKLYASGHYIIIHTARHMLTCHHDVKMVEQKVGEVTRDTLRMFGVPYHELIFGKPYADVYVDDKAVNPTHWVGKWTKSNIGYGWDIALHEQGANHKIRVLSENTCMKIATLEEGKGNIHFIENCPLMLREHIPKLYTSIPHENQMQLQLVMEYKKDCIPIGKLLACGLLTIDIFDKVVQLLSKMHNTSMEQNIPVQLVMQNYYPKLKERYDKSVFYKDNNIIINLEEVSEFFDKYTPTMSTCIHGDFWLSNMLWCHNTQHVYMIDMRGRLGNVLTIGGDTYYDYAKLMQSILGFDCILYGQSLPPQSIQGQLIKILQEQFHLSDDNIQDIKKIACVLMLGSLPFHEEFTKNAKSANRVLNVINEIWIDLVGL